MLFVMNDPAYQQLAEGARSIFEQAYASFEALIPVVGNMVNDRRTAQEESNQSTFIDIEGRWLNRETDKFDNKVRQGFTNDKAFA